MSPLTRELLRPWNLLSLSRVPMGALALVLRDDPVALLALLVAAVVTDLLDGAWSRLANGDHSVGAWLDPLCDKAFLLALLAALLVAHDAPLGLIALAATRDLLVVPALVAHLVLPGQRALEYTARWSGKAATGGQIAVGAALLAGRIDLAWPLAWICAALGVIAAFEYALRAWRALKSASTS